MFLVAVLALGKWHSGMIDEETSANHHPGNGGTEVTVLCYCFLSFSCIIYRWPTLVRNRRERIKNLISICVYYRCRTLWRVWRGSTTSPSSSKPSASLAARWWTLLTWLGTVRTTWKTRGDGRRWARPAPFWNDPLWCSSPPQRFFSSQLIIANNSFFA